MKKQPTTTSGLARHAKAAHDDEIRRYKHFLHDVEPLGRKTLASRYAMALVQLQALGASSHFYEQMADKFQHGYGAMKGIAVDLKVVELRRHSNGGRGRGKQRTEDAMDRYKKWAAERDDLVKGGKEPHDIAGILAAKHRVSVSTIRRAFQALEKKTRTS